MTKKYRVKLKDGTIFEATHSTLFQNVQSAGEFVKEKRAEGYEVHTKMHGSDSKRGSRVYVQVVWK